jgi:hypothetical protein
MLRAESGPLEEAVDRERRKEDTCHGGKGQIRQVHRVLA